MSPPLVLSWPAQAPEAAAAAPAPAGEAPIDALAAAMLDLGAGYGHALRTVLCVQRLLERIRRCGAASPEGTLLVQEIARLLTSLHDDADALADGRAAASVSAAALAVG